MIFSASIEAEKFADWMSLFCAINSYIEIPLGADQGKLFTSIMDPNHISMLTFKVKETVFEEFSASKNTKIGIDAEEIWKILTIGYSKKNSLDSLRIDFDGQELDLTLRSPLQKTERHFYFMNLSTIHEPDSYKPPNLEYTTKATLKAEVFKNVVQDCYKVSDKFTLWFNKKFWATAHDNHCSYSAEIKDTTEIESTEEAKGEYSLSIIIDILPYLRDDITISLGDEIPMRIDFSLWGAKCSFCVAPRVEREEREETVEEGLV